MKPREPYQFGSEWVWTRAYNGDALLAFSELLPGALFDALAGSTQSLVGRVKYYSSREAAMQALAEAEKRVGVTK